MAYQSVDRQHDIRHQGTYSLGQRNYAEWARDQLFGAVLESPGAAADAAIIELSQDPLFVHTADYLRERAHSRAERTEVGNNLTEPFGGIVRCKGVHGFRELSHARSVFICNPDSMQ